MPQDLLRRARECRFFRGALLDLAADLPPDDEGLDHLISDAIAKRDNDAFVRIVFAALGAGRRVDARHLEEGAALFDDPGQLAAAAWHFSGDVSRGLLGAVERENLDTERNAGALLLAGLWCKETGRSVPSELIAHARIQARRVGRNPFADLQVGILEDLVQDEGLGEVLNSHEFPRPPAVLKDEFISEWIGPIRESAFGIVPERPGPVVHSGFTVRRAVSRIGRNDPCPCGSGKKYKKCCMEKDQERLQDSSSVAGLTVAELREQRERFLTEEELSEMRSYELARLDAAKVAPGLKPLLIERLLLFGELEAAVQLFEKTGIPDDLDGRGPWLDCVDAVVRSQRKDLLLLLLAIRERQGTDRDLPIGARLLLADETDAVGLIEASALSGLRDNGDGLIIELAFALIEGRWPALGILVARGLIAHAGLFDAELLLEVLLEARDKLRLEPGDPLQPVLEQRFDASIEAHRDSEELQKAHERLELKNQELTRARSQLAQMQVELQKKEQETQASRLIPAILPAAAQPAAAEAPEIQELRRRVAKLKDELKDRHEERKRLRLELKDALQRLQEQPQNETTATESNEAKSAEERLLEQPEPFIIQPPRIPEFSPKFRESLAETPLKTVRHALLLIGRLAAGESGAFAGVKRLKTNRDIVRQRVGADYRLLFRLDSKSIELLALIPRRDLERKIRSLSQGAF